MLTNIKNKSSEGKEGRNYESKLLKVINMDMKSIGIILDNKA